MKYRSQSLTCREKRHSEEQSAILNAKIIKVGRG